MPRTAQPWQLQLRRRVMQDVILPGHPSEPHAQRNEASVLRTEAQRLPVLFAVVEEMTLIPLQHRPRDFNPAPTARARRTNG